ncbi:TBC1 domain family member 24 isoform X1 [Hydra vulgaris]|nr:TBC1 domain family member 24 [Hydra vulgaris]
MTGILQDCVNKSAHASVTVLEQPNLDIKKKDYLENVLIKHSVAYITPKEFKKIKIIVRKGIPMEQRKQYWLLFSGGKEVLQNTPNLFQKACDDLLGESHFYFNTEKLAANSHFLTPDGCYSLCKLLYVITNLNPLINYCPMLEPITIVMLHFMNEEDTFSCLSGILSKNLLDETQSENTITDCTLQDLLKFKKKKVYAKLKSYVPSHFKAAGHKRVIFPSLGKYIFDHLPLALLVRIVDCFLVDGPKIFYRVGLYLLNHFYTHSLTLDHFFCSSPQDLVANIGVHIQSLEINPDAFIKNILKIRLTSKQIFKLKQTNTTMSNSRYLDSTDDLIGQPVVTTNLSEVSDIIDLQHWQIVCSWLPLRLQVKKPYLLFTTNNDGYNLKTLYLKCEKAEQTLMIFGTTTGEVLGAYLSSSLKNRHNGNQNLSFFGTVETFIFKLNPESVCYHWNGYEQLHSKVSTYVFSSDSFDEKRTPKEHLAITSCFEANQITQRSQIKRDEHIRSALFISCDESRMVIGGGDGEGIAIDGDIHAGRSTWCRTFDNAPLSSLENGDFFIIRLDVFGFH